MIRAKRIAGRTIRRRRRLAARIDALAAASGVELLVWQRNVLVGLLDGAPQPRVRAREGGR